MINVNEVEIIIELNDDKKYPFLSNELSIFGSYTLPHVIDQYFNPLNWKEFKLEFKELTVDVGELRGDYLQYDLKTALEREFTRIVGSIRLDVVKKYDEIFHQVLQELRKIELTLKPSEWVPRAAVQKKIKESKRTGEVIAPIISASRIIQVEKLDTKLLQLERVFVILRKEKTFRTDQFQATQRKIKEVIRLLQRSEIKDLPLNKSESLKLVDSIKMIRAFITQFVAPDQEIGAAKVAPEKSGEIQDLKLEGKSIDRTGRPLNELISMTVNRNLKIGPSGVASYDLIGYFIETGHFPAITIVPDNDFDSFLIKSLENLGPTYIHRLFESYDETMIFQRLQKQIPEELFKEKVLNKIIEFKPQVVSENLIPSFSYLPLLDYLNVLLFEDQLPEWANAFSKYTIHDVVTILFHKNPSLLQSYFIGVLTQGNKAIIQKRLDQIFTKAKKASISKIVSVLFAKSQRVIKILNAVNNLLDQENLFERKDLTAQKQFFEWMISKNIFKDPDTYQLDLEDVFQLFSSKYGIKSDRIVTKTLKKDIYADRSLQKRKFKSTPKPPLQVENVVLYFLQYGSLPTDISGPSANLKKLKEMIRNLKSHDLFQHLTAYQIIKNQNLKLLEEELILHLISSSKYKGRKVLIDLYKKSNALKDLDQSDLLKFLMYYVTLDLPVQEQKFEEEVTKFYRKKSKDETKKVYVLRNEVDEIHVKNAGLVMLWPHFRRYFSILEMLNDKSEFISEEAHERAVLLLQYLATKQSYAEEHYLPLNKILVGYPLERPVINEVILTEKERDVSLALLRSIIKSWPGFQNSGTDSLRGGFLVRDGILSKREGNWNLTVEKKAYDLLLDTLPWGFSKIKLPWNPYMIDVEWN